MDNYRYILFVTHADDELVNMSHFLFKENSSCVLVTSDHPKRREKFLQLMCHLNKESLHLPFTPGFLLSYDRDWIYYNMRGSFLSLKEEVDNIIVLPSTFDTHPEHLLVSALGLRLHAENPGTTSVIFSTCRAKEHHIVNVPRKFRLLKKYYEEEFRNLNSSNYGITKREYHS